MNWRTLVEFVGFQIVWLACAIGAAKGSSLPGLLATAVYIAMQLAHDRSRASVLTIAASGMTGAAIESLLAGSGLLLYAASWPAPHLAPAWIVALWLAFGTTLATTARLLGQRVSAKAALLGAIFGPLSYAAGIHLGALSIAEPRWLGYSVVAIAWALSYPGLIAVRLWLEARQ